LIKNFKIITISIITIFILAVIMNIITVNATNGYNNIDVCTNHEKPITLTTQIKQATFGKDGLISNTCPNCTYNTEVIIPKVSSLKLSSTKYTYDGKTHKPTIVLKDSKETVLKEGTDYKLTYPSSAYKTGKYGVKISLIGNYTGEKTLYYSIVPKHPSTSSAVLYGYDDVKFTWNKSPGATGYAIYYKKSTSKNYTLLGKTTNNYIKKANLSDGTKYYFKVVPFVKANNEIYYSKTSKVSSVTTLKKMNTPTVTHASNSTVKVSWKDIEGQSGYQISRSTSKIDTNIVATYKTTSGTSKIVNATLNKDYYYKVRAYKIINDTKIYGPWSNVKYFKNCQVIGTYKDKTGKITIYKEWYKNAWCYVAHLEFSNYKRFGTSCGKGYYGGTETVYSAHKRLGSILTVNGCYSAPYLKYPVARSGKVYNNKACWVPAVYSNKSGKLMSAWETGGTPGIAGQDLKTLVKNGKVSDTFCFGPPILADGVVTTNKDTSRAQRTFIGTNGNPGDIWIVVSDGRYIDGKSPGLTARECGQLLKNKGCTFGVPLDGGGSSSMVFKGKTLNKTSGRAVVDFVYFK